MTDIDSLPKRHREEENSIKKEDFQDLKHQKTINQLPSVLEEDVEEFSPEYFADIFTMLQEELSFSDSEMTNLDVSSDSCQEPQTSALDCSQSSKEYIEKEDERFNNVLKHLLEASDAELGLPNREENGNAEVYGRNFPFPVNSVLWEFEDETNNYYAILQSGFFL